MTDLKDLTDGTLRDLRDKIEMGYLELPLSQAGLAAAGMADVSPYIACLEKSSKEGLLLLLNAVLAEREGNLNSRIDLVWTGPEAKASTARDTRVVMRELFEAARKRVLIAGYRFDNGEDLFAPLHRNMERHGVSVQIFLDIPAPQKGTNVEEHIDDYIKSFRRTNWPFPGPSPSLFYDPRTLQRGPWASIHAKCVCIDDRTALVGSANFTERGQTRNIEMGVLIQDHDFARRVSSQWQNLVNLGLVVPG